MIEHHDSRQWVGDWTLPRHDLWRDDGLCADLDPDLFSEYVEGETVEQTQARTVTAVQWCLACPVQAQCLDAGERGLESGVWGGVMLHSGLPGKPRGRPAGERSMIRDCVCKRARHVHGTEQAYISDKCRCRACKTAHAQRMAWRRRQHAYGRPVSQLVPTVGSRRRLEALACLGWSCNTLAARMGCDAVVLQRARTQKRIHQAKAQRIADLYDELWDVWAPAGTQAQRISVTRTRMEAARRGFVPPLGWDDDEIEDPAARPKHRLVGPQFKHGDVVARAEHVAVLTQAGLSAREIADRLGTTPRNVSRDRARTREAAA